MLGGDAPDVRRLVRQTAELDELRALRDESRRLVLELEARYRGETAIASLKIRHNNVLGYYVETTAAHIEKLTAGGGFIHRQTMANAARFTTVELGELERRARSADPAFVAQKGETIDAQAKRLDRASQTLVFAYQQVRDDDERGQKLTELTALLTKLRQ